MNAHVLAESDRRAPRRADRADQIAQHFHPQAIQDDPLHERAREAAYRFVTGQEVSREDWAALKAEATLWASPAVTVIPNF